MTTLPAADAANVSQASPQQENNVVLLDWPGDKDWLEVRRRAWLTVGKEGQRWKPPPMEWRKGILAARHSPVRYLRFSFLLKGIPSWVSVHLVRHVHAQPYVMTQRHDNDPDHDRDSAPQGAPVNMIWDMNAEELMGIANKRLCQKASLETRHIVANMCRLVEKYCPEFEGHLVPMCQYHGGVCYEMKPCGHRVTKQGD